MTDPYCHGNEIWAIFTEQSQSCESAFIWRVKVSKLSDNRELYMKYFNWQSGQPDYGERREACVVIGSGHSFGWNDIHCSVASCFVCQIDIMVDTGTDIKTPE